MDALVILEFCTQPSPVVAKLATEYAAKGVRTVTIDVAKEKLIVAQFRLQAVPTIYAFFQGQPVADLTSYLSESQLRAALDQLLTQLKISGGETAEQAPIEPLMAMGEEILAGGDGARAVSVFRQIHEMAPDNPEVAGALARALVAAGEFDEVRSFLAGLPPASATHAAVSRAQAVLDLAANAPVADTTAIEGRIAANPDDLDARFELGRSQGRGGRSRRSRRRAARNRRSRARLERGRGAQALPPIARSSGPGRSVGAGSAAAAVGFVVHLIRAGR